MVSVTAFGAVGDGVTDDTAAINAATASLSLTGGTVFFPIGQYRISGPIFVYDSLILVGESFEGSQIRAYFDNESAFRAADIEVGASFVTFHNINVRNEGGVNSVGIDFRNLIWSTVRDSLINHFDIGIWFGGHTDGEAASWNNLIDHNRIYNGMVCVLIDGIWTGPTDDDSPANYITIQNCEITPRLGEDAVGVYHKNGGEIQVLWCDISYNILSTGILVGGQATSGMYLMNRFENMGEVEPSHATEFEYGQHACVMTDTAVIGGPVHFQTSEDIEFTGTLSGGTFTLTKEGETTAPITWTADTAEMSLRIKTALELLPVVGTHVLGGNNHVGGGVRVAFISGVQKVMWRGSTGRSNRTPLTGDGSGLTGGDIEIMVGTVADAIFRSKSNSPMTPMATGNDILSYLPNEQEHFYFHQSIVSQQQMVLATAGAALNIQEWLRLFPSLTIDGSSRMRWRAPDDGSDIATFGWTPGGRNALGYSDETDVVMPATNFIDPSNSDYDDWKRGVLNYYKNEDVGTNIARDSLRFYPKDIDDLVHIREVFYGVNRVFNLNPASIPAGQSIALTVSVPGVVAGDGVVVCPPAALSAGVIFSGLVTAADTVEIRLFNSTGIAINPPSADWVVQVMMRQPSWWS